MSRNTSAGRHAKGHLLDEDGNEYADTKQCAHCGRHWVAVKGSGAKRGFCMLCMAPLCGAHACMVDCVPYEKRIETLEG